MDNKIRNAICLLVDGLNPAYLSPHGCTWIDTPAFDQLASESVMFERAVTETVDPGRAMWSFLLSQHPARRTESDITRSPQLESLKTADIHRVLLTDDADLVRHGATHFDQIIQLDVFPEPDEMTSADDVSDTCLARCFASALNELPKQASPFLCVMHLTSLTKIWDAPLSLREKHRDVDDPQVLDIVTPPSQTGDFDPDEILGVTHAYAAQLETLDTCLHVFMHELQQDGLLDQTRLITAGVRGFPLGHRRQMGHELSHVASDATWVPLFVRPANCEQEILTAFRCHELTTTSEWLSLATGWLLDKATHRLDAVMRGETSANGRSREFSVICESAARAIRTPAWLLVEQGERVELFVKPDDRWDVNPVQDRCRGIAEDLREILGSVCEQLGANQSPTMDSLADELLFGLK